MLIDTDATTSMISTELYNKITVVEMVAVNSMIGSSEFDMNVKGVSYPATVIVAAINVLGIIGLDFVSEYNSEIKLKPCSIVVDGRWTIYQLATERKHLLL